MKMMRRVWWWSDPELGLGVATFDGNKGDRKVDQYVKAVSREDCPFSTGLISGKLLREIAPDGIQKVYLPGDTTENDPDLTPGFAQVVCLEDSTRMICIGPVSPTTGRFYWLKMGKKTHRSGNQSMDVILLKGHVVALVMGTVELPDGGVINAPEVVSAKTKDVPLKMYANTVMMEGWR